MGQTTSSPYSRFALGNLKSTSFANTFGMGSVGIGLSESTILNITNPASYSFINRNRPIYDLGIDAKLTTISSSTDQGKSNSSGLRNVALGLPIAKKWGISFGLLQFSNIGYDITSNEVINDSINVNYVFEGSGGINRVFLGTAYKLIDNPGERLSFGINSSFLFGSLIKERKAVFPESSNQASLVQSTTNVKDFNFDFGVQYRFYPKDSTGKIKPAIGYSFGAIYAPSQKLKADQDLLVASFFPQDLNGNLKDIIDVVQFDDSLRGNLTVPQKYGIGGTLIIRGNRNNLDTSKTQSSIKRNKLLLVSLDLEQREWSNYTESFENASFENNLINSSKIALGLQFTPHASQYRTLGIPYYQHITFRTGFRYSQTYLNINDTPITEYATSIGLGIPVFPTRSKSSLNFGTEFGGRGTTANNLIKEQFLHFYFGLTITPANSRNEKWFVKRKYN